MNICVVTLFTDEIQNESYWATLNKKKYCDKYDMFYRFYNGRASKRHSQWDKIQCVLQNILEFDYVIWMDADTIINNFDISFYDIINDNKNYDAIFCKDICYSEGVNHLLINTGVMIFKNTAWTRNLLINTWNAIDDYNIEQLDKHSYNGFPHEQGVICEILLKETPSKYIIHDSTLFNTHPNITNEKTFVIHYMGSRVNQDKLNEFVNKTKKINEKNNINNQETFDVIKLKNHKICVVSLYTEHIKHIAELSIPNKSEYSKKHGYFFEYHSGRMSDRHPAWDKIKFIQTLLDKDYDYIIWMDNDTIIMHQEYRFDFICSNYSDKNLIISSDVNYKKLNDDIDFTNLENFRIVNNGVFILKNNEWSKNFLEECWNINTNTNSGVNNSHKSVNDKQINHHLWPFEQGAVHVSLSKKNPDDYVIVNNKIMNSFKHHYDKFEFVCHFTGNNDSVSDINSFIKIMKIRNIDGYIISKGESKVIFRDGYSLLVYNIYKTKNHSLYFQFFWDTSNLTLKYLSHNFKIVHNNREKEITFNSNYEGAFEIEDVSNTKIYHTYEYYGEKNWYELTYL